MESFYNYHLGNEAKIITSEIPGINSKKLLDIQGEIESSIVSYPQSMPIALKRAKGAIIEDVDGNRFIDFFSGCGVLNVGHCNQDVLEYVENQQKELIHALDFPTENKIKLIRTILEHLPKEVQSDYKVAFCAPTGSDSIEAAIKLAKLYTGRDHIVAFQGSYHGMTAGALAVTSDTTFRKKLHSIMPNVHFVPYSYCFRCAFNKESSNCSMDCATYLDSLLSNTHSGVPKPAAIILEPIQGEGGTIVPKPGFLDRIIEIGRKHDILIICDEVQSGFFRTGKFLASMHESSVPDIFTISKGLGGIGFPISAIIYKKEIEVWGKAAHIGTFRGNQVSVAAANGAFNFIEKNNIKSHVQEISHYLMKELIAISEGSQLIGEVRGRGLFIGVEFVKSKETKEPYPEFVKKLRTRCFQKGLLFEVGGHYSNVIRILPPLIINKEIVENACSILKDALFVLEEELLSKEYNL